MSLHTAAGNRRIRKSLTLVLGRHIVSRKAAERAANVLREAIRTGTLTADIRARLDLTD